MSSEKSPQQWSLEAVKKFMADNLAAIDAPNNASLLDSCLRGAKQQNNHYTGVQAGSASLDLSQVSQTPRSLRLYFPQLSEGLPAEFQTRC